MTVYVTFASGAYSTGPTAEDVKALVRDFVAEKAAAGEKVIVADASSELGKWLDDLVEEYPDTLTLGYGPK